MDFSDPKLHKLLRKIEQERLEYEIAARLTGENFNLFSVLGLSTAEVRTHSAFIAELLNPKGSHGQGAIYLELFLNSLGITPHEFTSEGVTVKVEYYVGRVDQESSMGGRIDIFMVDKCGHNILIENKIEAGDGEQQLLRYHNAYPNAIILYLTLSGAEPGEHSMGDKMFPVRCISYRTEILNWLVECHRASISLPVIRETIVQYKHLLKRLTHQTSENKMRKVAQNYILANPDMIDTIVLLGDAWENIIKQVEDAIGAKKPIFEDEIVLDNGVHLFRSRPVITNSFAIAFRACRGGNEAVADSEAQTYLYALKAAHPKSNIARSNFWNVGYFYPTPFGAGKGVRELPKANIIELFENKNGELEAFVDELVSEAENVTEQLLDELVEQNIRPVQ